jgi:hypothetical protein
MFALLEAPYLARRHHKPQYHTVYWQHWKESRNISTQAKHKQGHSQTCNAAIEQGHDPSVIHEFAAITKTLAVWQATLNTNRTISYNAFFV